MGKRAWLLLCSLLAVAAVVTAEPECDSGFRLAVYSLRAGCAPYIFYVMGVSIIINNINNHLNNEILYENVNINV